MSSKKRSSQQKDSHCELLSMLDRVEKKLDSLKENLETFKNDNVAIKSIVKYQNPKYKRMFTIKSIPELENMNDDINATNEQEYIATVKAIIGTRGITKGLADLVVLDVLVKFNVDGTHDKLRFLNYQKFINVLFMATYENNTSEKSFKENLKHGIKLAKNRFLKDRMKEKHLNSTPPVMLTGSPNTSKEL